MRGKACRGLPYSLSEGVKLHDADRRFCEDVVFSEHGGGVESGLSVQTKSAPLSPFCGPQRMIPSLCVCLCVCFILNKILLSPGCICLSSQHECLIFSGCSIGPLNEARLPLARSPAAYSKPLIAEQTPPPHRRSFSTPATISHRPPASSPLLSPAFCSRVRGSAEAEVFHLCPVPANVSRSCLYFSHWFN